MKPDFVVSYRFGKPKKLPREAMSEALRSSLGMFETGVQIMRENLRRKFPRATSAQIEMKLEAWLVQKPDMDESGGPWRRRVLPT